MADLMRERAAEHNVLGNSESIGRTSNALDEKRDEVTIARARHEGDAASSGEIDDQPVSRTTASLALPLHPAVRSARSLHIRHTTVTSASARIAWTRAFARASTAGSI